jgi:hypothetical protein
MKREKVSRKRIKRRGNTKMVERIINYSRKVNDYFFCWLFNEAGTMNRKRVGRQWSWPNRGTMPQLFTCMD